VVHVEDAGLAWRDKPMLGGDLAGARLEHAHPRSAIDSSTAAPISRFAHRVAGAEPNRTRDSLSTLRARRLNRDQHAAARHRPTRRSPVHLGSIAGS
jgi:hypothetical protein